LAWHYRCSSVLRKLRTKRAVINDIDSDRITLMHIAKKIGLVILSPIFVFLLYFLALDFGIIHTAGNPGRVKQIIADSGVYSGFVPAALRQAEQKSQDTTDVSLVDPAVKAAAANAFSPQFLQTTTENIIDGIYHWLDGKVPQPDFKVDLSSRKADFATLVADHAKQVASGLPRCTTAQLIQLQNQTGGFDVFKAQCLPPGVTPDSAAAQVRSELLNNKDFLKNPIITADSLKSPQICYGAQTECGPSNPQPLFQKEPFKNLPDVYQWAKRSPFILSVLTILCGVAIVFLSRSWQLGLRHVGVVIIVVGVIMLIFAWSLKHVANDKLIPKIKIDNAVLQTDVRKLATDFVKQLDNNYWFFGSLYVVLGAGAITAGEIARRRSGQGAVGELPAATVEKRQRKLVDRES
jgi:hypothetical protein